MGSIVCPITGLPLREGDPIVALLLVAASDRTNGGVISDPMGMWVPVSAPLRAIYNESWPPRWDRQQEAVIDLWTEALRLNAVPRRGIDGIFDRINGATSLLHFLTASRRGKLYVRELREVSAPKVGNHVPTFQRVHRLLERVSRKAFVWDHHPRDVFPFVRVTLRSVEHGTKIAHEAVDCVAKAAERRGWNVWIVDRSDATDQWSRTLRIAPSDIASAVLQESDRREACPPRRRHPVAFSVYSRLGWKAMLRTPARSPIDPSASFDRNYFLRCIHSARAQWLSLRSDPAQRHASSVSMLAKTVFSELFDSPFCGFPLIADVPWMLGRLMDASSPQDVLFGERRQRRAICQIAELISVDRSFRAQGRTWLPPRYAVGVEAETTRAMRKFARIVLDG